jgi:Transposase
MLYAGLDLSRKRLDFRLLDEAGETVEVGAVAPDADGLRGLARRVARFSEPVLAAIESTNGARFVHDQLEQAGWDVEIADAVKVKGLAPLACKTDRIDAWVLAELCRRELVPAIGCPTRRCAQSGSGPVSACISSVIARRSSNAFTRSCSRTASPALCPTCSASPAARCSTGWRCRSPGPQPSTRVSA